MTLGYYTVCNLIRNKIIFSTMFSGLLFSLMKVNVFPSLSLTKLKSILWTSKVLSIWTSLPRSFICRLVFFITINSVPTPFPVPHKLRLLKRNRTCVTVFPTLSHLQLRPEYDPSETFGDSKRLLPWYSSDNLHFLSSSNTYGSKTSLSFQETIPVTPQSKGVYLGKCLCHDYIFLL